MDYSTPIRVMDPPFQGFMITLRHSSVGRTPLEEGSARPRDLYLTTHNTHIRKTSMPSSRMRTSNSSKRMATDPHFRQHEQGVRLFNLLNPTGHVMNQQFNIQQL